MKKLLIILASVSFVTSCKKEVLFHPKKVTMVCGIVFDKGYDQFGVPHLSVFSNDSTYYIKVSQILYDSTVTNSTGCYAQ